MNYIAEINRFHELLPQSRMTPSSIALWYGLMHIFNKAGWPSEKTVSLDQIKQDTKLSKAYIYREIVRLQNDGIITFIAGSGSRSCTFRMLSLSKSWRLRLERWSSTVKRHRPQKKMLRSLKSSRHCLRLKRQKVQYLLKKI